MATYVKVNAAFSDDGFMEPLSLTFEDKTYPISEVVSTRYMPREEVESRFPEVSDTVYHFKVRIGRQEKGLYYEPSRDIKTIGRWFVEPVSQDG